MTETKIGTILSVTALIISIVVGAITVGDRVYFYTFSKKIALNAELRQVMGEIVQIKLNNIEDGAYLNPGKFSSVQAAQSGQNRALMQRGLAIIDLLGGEVGPGVYSFFGNEFAEIADWANNIEMLENALRLSNNVGDEVSITRDLAGAYSQQSERQDIDKSRVLFTEVKALIKELHPSYHILQYHNTFRLSIRGEVLNANCEVAKSEAKDYVNVIRNHPFTNFQMTSEAEKYVRDFDRNQNICKLQ